MDKGGGVKGGMDNVLSPEGWVIKVTGAATSGMVEIVQVQSA